MAGLITKRFDKGGDMPKRRLKSLEDVRRYLANLINRTEAGKIEPGTAGKLGYLANSLAKIIAGSSLEERVNKIENILNKGFD